MYFYYFLTISKVWSKHSSCDPTRLDYLRLLSKLRSEHSIHIADSKYPVKCFEYKSVGCKPNKNHFWIHFHAMVKSQSRVKYAEVKYKHYSISFRICRTLQDVVTYSGYIQKHMKDQVTLNPVRTLKVAKRIVKPILTYYKDSQNST